MVSSLRPETDSCDSSNRHPRRQHGLHSECCRGTRTLAFAATAALLCLSSPSLAVASSRHIPEARHSSLSGGAPRTNVNRFRFRSPRNSNNIGNDRATAAAAAAARPSAASSSGRLQFPGGANEEANEAPFSNSNSNSTLTSTAAYGQTEVEEQSSVTTTSFFRLPSETLKGQEEQLRGLSSPSFVSPSRHRPTTVQIQTRFVISLMGLAGFVEGFCVRRHGCFPNLMTGTLLKAAEAVGSWNLPAASVHASMVGCYIGGGWMFSRWKKTAAQASSSSNKLEQKKSTLQAVSVLSTIFLLLSDVSARLSFLRPARLPLLAAAFGIINAGTMDVGTGVTYAMTGHITKVGQGLATGSLLQKPKDAHSKPSADRTSAQGLVAFWVAALVANLFLEVLNKTTAPASAAAATLLTSIPLGTTVAIAYAAIFRWYVRATARASAAEAKSK